MKVWELKALLEGFDDQTELFVASDEEGNSFHHLAEVNAEHIFGTGYQVDVVHDDDVDDYNEGDLYIGLVLWP